MRKTRMLLYFVIMSMVGPSVAQGWNWTEIGPGRRDGSDEDGDDDDLDEPAADGDVNENDAKAGPASKKVATPARHGRDYMTKRDKGILCHMMFELYQEAFHYVQQTMGIRNAHEAALAFQIGHMMGLIRERYRRMMEYYREMSNKEVHAVPPRTKIWPPAMTRPRVMFYIEIYEFIHEIEMELEKFIEMLENIPLKDVGMTPRTMTFSRYTRKNQKNRNTRSRGRTPKRRNNLEEERYKSRLREQFILRKMGLNDSQHTARKRFLFGWPVEDTWDNLQYS